MKFRIKQIETNKQNIGVTTYEGYVWEISEPNEVTALETLV